MLGNSFTGYITVQRSFSNNYVRSILSGKTANTFVLRRFIMASCGTKTMQKRMYEDDRPNSDVVDEDFVHWKAKWLV